MTLRCTTCSEFIFYDEKREKMTMILNCPSCRGKVEMMKPSGKLSGIHPIYPEKTFNSKLYDGPYYYAYKNQKEEYFVWNNDKLVRIENPVAVTNSSINIH